MHRRSFLKTSLAAGAFALGAPPLFGAAAAEARVPLFGAAAAGARGPWRRFAPVKVFRDRLIRTVVGLRPYRRQGFVVRAERLGDKTVVHNYGHGGAGVTLSWGTSTMAADLARETGHGVFAVLGCGVMGLTTARVLQRRGGQVTIYAKTQPPETTSNIAGAFWLPTSSYRPREVDAAFLERFGLACRLSNRAFQDLIGEEYGVRWVESFRLDRQPPQVAELIGGARLYPETRDLSGAPADFGFPHVTRFYSMMIEPAVYLAALLRDFYTAGGCVVAREFRGREELAALAEPVVMNCTGLGAGALFGDAGIEPMRGQLEVLLPQPELDYCYLADDSYMFPRRDGVILGGTFERGKWSLAPEAETTAKTLLANARIARGLRRRPTF
jgi:glycine/D-amino acid oxidase-like deaminating enzyme